MCKARLLRRPSPSSWRSQERASPSWNISSNVKNPSASTQQAKPNPAPTLPISFWPRYELPFLEPKMHGFPRPGQSSSIVTPKSVWVELMVVFEKHDVWVRLLAHLNLSTLQCYYETIETAKWHFHAVFCLSIHLHSCFSCTKWLIGTL